MPTYDEIFGKVQATLVDALGVDEEEVTRGATLQGDLGAESIDFLDIVFRLERNFGIKIPRGELFPGKPDGRPGMGDRRQAHRQRRGRAEGSPPVRRSVPARRESRRRPDRGPLHRRHARPICAEQTGCLIDLCNDACSQFRAERSVRSRRVAVDRRVSAIAGSRRLSVTSNLFLANSGWCSPQ